MWDQAVDLLNDEDRIQIDFTQEDKRTALSDLLVTVGEKRRTQKHIRFKKRNGDTVDVRGLFKRIAEWVNRFKDVGDILIQYDPQHAAIPWAAVRFVLQVMVNENQTYEAMALGLEYVSSLIARYSAIEGAYLESSILKEQLAEALLKLYTAVLVFLARARRYYTRRHVGKLPISRAVLSRVVTQSQKVDG